MARRLHRFAVMSGAFGLAMAGGLLVSPLANASPIVAAGITRSVQPLSVGDGCTQEGSATVNVPAENGNNAYNVTAHYYQTEEEGDSGACVTNLQKDLNNYRAGCAIDALKTLTVDGDYGPDTAADVTDLENFENNENVEVNNEAFSVDGIAGLQVWTLLRSNVCEQAQG